MQQTRYERANGSVPLNGTGIALANRLIAQYPDDVTRQVVEFHARHRFRSRTGRANSIAIARASGHCLWLHVLRKVGVTIRDLDQFSVQNAEIALSRMEQDDARTDGKGDNAPYSAHTVYMTRALMSAFLHAMGKTPLPPKEDSTPSVTAH